MLSGCRTGKLHPYIVFLWCYAFCKSHVVCSVVVVAFSAREWLSLGGEAERVGTQWGWPAAQIKRVWKCAKVIFLCSTQVNQQLTPYCLSPESCSTERGMWAELYNNSFLSVHQSEIRGTFIHQVIGGPHSLAISSCRFQTYVETACPCCCQSGWCCLRWATSRPDSCIFKRRKRFSLSLFVVLHNSFPINAMPSLFNLFFFLMLSLLIFSTGIVI